MAEGDSTKSLGNPHKTCTSDLSYRVALHYLFGLSATAEATENVSADISHT